MYLLHWGIYSVIKKFIRGKISRNKETENGLSKFLKLRIENLHSHCIESR